MRCWTDQGSEPKVGQQLLLCTKPIVLKLPGASCPFGIDLVRPRSNLNQSWLGLPFVAAISMERRVTEPARSIDSDKRSVAQGALSAADLLSDSLHRSSVSGSACENNGIELSGWLLVPPPRPRHGAILGGTFNGWAFEGLVRDFQSRVHSTPPSGVVEDHGQRA